MTQERIIQGNGGEKQEQNGVEEESVENLNVVRRLQLKRARRVQWSG